MKLRPDGKLEIDGAVADVGAALLALVKNTAADEDFAVSWIRNLVAALKAYATRPAALGRILAPLEAAAKDDKFLASMLETRRIFQPCALTAANHVVHFDRWWNPAVENQASDRAYRIG